MQEVFYEESATIQNQKSAARKYNTFNIFSIVFYSLMIIWLIISINFAPVGGGFLPAFIFIVLPFAMFLVSGILFGKFKNKFYVDYDYTFVTGSIRISKVIKNIKRRFIVMFETSSIEKIGKYGSETYQTYENMQGIVRYIFTSNSIASDGKDLYYIVASINSEKTLMILECSELFIVNILKFSNKNILEKEFSK